MAVNELALRDSWQRFVGGHVWDHAATLTTRNPVTDQALYDELRSGFIRRLARMAQCRVPWFAALEHTHLGRPHLHVLLAGTKSLRTKQLERAWNYGHSRMTRLRNQHDAVRYVVKSLGSHPDNYELSRVWIPRVAE